MICKDVIGLNKLNEKKAKIYLKIISNVLLGENFSKKGTFKELCDKLILNIDTIKSNQKVKTGNGDSDGGCIIKKGMVEEYDGYDVRIPEYKFFQQKSEKEWEFMQVYMSFAMLVLIY